MSEESRKAIQCPDCEGASVATGSGDAVCSVCQKKFALAENTAPKILPRSLGMPESKGSMIRRNIDLSSQGKNSSFGSFGKPKEPALVKPDEVKPGVVKPDVVKPDAVRPDAVKSDAVKPDAVRRTAGAVPLEKERRSRQSSLQEKSFVQTHSVSLMLGGIIVLLIAGGGIKISGMLSGRKQKDGTIEERLVGQEREFYRNEFPRIRSQFKTFLSNATPAELPEYVLKVDHLERKVRNHTKTHNGKLSSIRLEEELAFWNVVFEESPGFVEIVWDTKNDGFLEGVFVNVDGLWLLDWEQHVRYSSENWTLFHQRIGSLQSGIFRVYLEKVSEGEDDASEPWLRFKVYPAVSDERRRNLEASKLIRLKGRNELMTKVERLFVDFSSQSEGFSKFWTRDPDGLRRATVELEWVKNATTGEEEMVIKNLLADNWRALKKGEEDLEPQSALKE